MIDYLENEFPKAEFKTENEISSLRLFVIILLGNGSEEFRQIAINKLQSDESWKKYREWFDHSLKNQGIEI